MIKKFALTALLTISLVVGSIFGTYKTPTRINPEIPVSQRVSNFGPGYCMWCDMEMIGNHLKIPALYNLAHNREKYDQDEFVQDPDGSFTVIPKNYGVDFAVARKLKALHVRYKMAKDGNRDVSLINEAVKYGYGCVVGVKACLVPGFDSHETSCHALLITEFDVNKNYVCYIDPNKISVEYEGTVKWFSQAWNGFVLVIYPN